MALRGPDQLPGHCDAKSGPEEMDLEGHPLAEELEVGVGQLLVVVLPRHARVDEGELSLDHRLWAAHGRGVVLRHHV